MKRSLAAVVLPLLALAACSDEVTTPVTPVPAIEAAQSASGKYIVVFKDAAFNGPRFRSTAPSPRGGGSTQPSHV